MSADPEAPHAVTVRWRVPVLEQQQAQGPVMDPRWCAAQARLLEHNVRFGDPECQCLMMRLRSDLLEVLLAAAEGRLGASTQLQWSPEKALTVRRPCQSASNTPDSSLRQHAKRKLACVVYDGFINDKCSCALL